MMMSLLMSFIYFASLSRTWCPFTTLELCWADCLPDVLTLSLQYGLLLLTVYTPCFIYSYAMKVNVLTAWYSGAEGSGKL